MSDMDEFGANLQRRLEDFLASLREDEMIKNWIDHPHFIAMYEKYEANVRSSLAEAIERYKAKAVEAESEDGFFRDLIIQTIKETLDQYLDSFQRIMRTSASTMVAAFGDLSRG